MVQIKLSVVFLHAAAVIASVVARPVSPTHPQPGHADPHHQQQDTSVSSGHKVQAQVPAPRPSAVAGPRRPRPAKGKSGSDSGEVGNESHMTRVPLSSRSNLKLNGPRIMPAPQSAATHQKENHQQDTSGHKALAPAGPHGTGDFGGDKAVEKLVKDLGVDRQHAEGYSRPGHWGPLPHKSHQPAATHQKENHQQDTSGHKPLAPAGPHANYFGGDKEANMLVQLHGVHPDGMREFSRPGHWAPLSDITHQKENQHEIPRAPKSRSASWDSMYTDRPMGCGCTNGCACPQPPLKPYNFDNPPPLPVPQ